MRFCKTDPCKVRVGAEGGWQDSGAVRRLKKHIFLHMVSGLGLQFSYKKYGFKNHGFYMVSGLFLHMVSGLGLKNMVFKNRVFIWKFYL